MIKTLYKIKTSTNQIFLAIFIIVLYFFSGCNESPKGIKITVQGLKDENIILGYYFNNMMKPKDTIKLDKNGEGFISPAEKTNEGIYFLFLPNGKHSDFLVSKDQNFSIKTSLSTPLISQKISGSKETKLYSDFLKYKSEKQKEIEILSLKLNNSDKNSTEHKNIINEIELLNKKIIAKTDSIIQSNQGTLLAEILLLSKKIDMKNYNYFDHKEDSIKLKSYRKHYFDNIDLNDERLLYTPYFKQFLDIYFREIIKDNFRKLIKDSKELINSSTNPEVRKYLIKYFFNLASTGHFSGNDNFLTEIAEKYYFSGEAIWVSPVFLEKLRNKITQIKYSLIGKKAPDLLMESYNGQYYRLSEEKSDLTILIFWDPNCGHCKTGIPQIKKHIWEKYKDRGIKIFGVYTRPEKKPWTDFIEKHDLYEWINVYDPLYKTNFWEFYNIHSTPTIYILDKNNTIIYKMTGKDFDFNKLLNFTEKYLNSRE
jgi:peroxiredoxin